MKFISKKRLLPIVVVVSIVLSLSLLVHTIASDPNVNGATSYTTITDTFTQTAGGSTTTYTTVSTVTNLNVTYVTTETITTTVAASTSTVLAFTTVYTSCTATTTNSTNGLPQC